MHTCYLLHLKMEFLEKKNINHVHRLGNLEKVLDQVLSRFHSRTNRLEEDDWEECPFVDDTKSVTFYWNHGGETVLLLPNGIYQRLNEPVGNRRYEIIDEKVYECCITGICGKYLYRRTKRARRIKIVKNYPYNLLYKSQKEFAEIRCGYISVADYEVPGGYRYGYYYRYYGDWDYYNIGGRWSESFRVRNNCQFAFHNKKIEPYRESLPGYKWVAGARKKDICWDKMIDRFSGGSIFHWDSILEYDDEEGWVMLPVGGWDYTVDEKNMQVEQFLEKIDNEDFLLVLDGHS